MRLWPPQVYTCERARVCLCVEVRLSIEHEPRTTFSMHSSQSIECNFFLADFDSIVCAYGLINNIYGVPHCVLTQWYLI